MRQMSRIPLRTAGAAVLALGASVAHAHPGHGLASLFDSHSHGIGDLIAAAIASFGPVELIALYAICLGAVLVWERRSSRPSATE